MSQLFYHYGYTETEIADHYKVSPSRVSQRITRVQKCLSARIAKETRRQRDGAREVENMGGIETEIISFKAHEKVALEKPREMAKLNEEGFHEWIT